MFRTDTKSKDWLRLCLCLCLCLRKFYVFGRILRRAGSAWRRRGRVGDHHTDQTPERWTCVVAKNSPCHSTATAFDWLGWDVLGRRSFKRCCLYFGKISTSQIVAGSLGQQKSPLGSEFEGRFSREKRTKLGWRTAQQEKGSLSKVYYIKKWVWLGRGHQYVKHVFAFLDGLDHLEIIFNRFN